MDAERDGSKTREVKTTKKDGGEARLGAGTLSGVVPAEGQSRPLDLARATVQKAAERKAADQNSRRPYQIQTGGEADLDGP